MLTLPPVVGQKYIYVNTEDKKQYECTITEEEPYEDILIYRSRAEHHDWVFWPDGEAKLPGQAPVAKLLRDVDDLPDTIDSTSAIEKLRAKREEMMQRLRALGTP